MDTHDPERGQNRPSSEDGLSPVKKEPIRGTGLLKAVTIHDEPETINPTAVQSGAMPGSPSLPCQASSKLHRASISGKKLSGRPALSPKMSSSSSLHQNVSSLNLGAADDADVVSGKSQDTAHVLSQVVTWLLDEKTKRSRKNHKESAAGPSSEPTLAETQHSGSKTSHDEFVLALEKLEKILAGFMASTSTGVGALARRNLLSLRRRGSIAQKMKRNSTAASSDTEHLDGDLLVPNVEAVLDNSATIMRGEASVNNDVKSVRTRERDPWADFKCEVVRLTHTLRLKGWRRVPMERGKDISVERLSGALTNAVYVVAPPNDLPEVAPVEGGATSGRRPRPPSKLLLRIYGPQVEHLIDRDGELAILRRLARKKIGPRLLGTFTNGRFEEFFNARTLTPEDLRIPETSIQIAKRMRELHDGIELLQEERDAGPTVWKNWDKWVGRCEQVITWLDKQITIRQDGEGLPPTTERWMQRGFVCGVEWPVFRKAVEKCRTEIEKTHGGKSGIKKQLVFAHNDTQYGNLLRLHPSGESPLLLPSNEHRQLVVIDFEYASANTPGQEFANHFTEWCYNYHHPALSFACNTNAYPTPQEQHRFITNYVNHRPPFHPSASTTPKMLAKESSVAGFFHLDSRTHSGSGVPDYTEEEKAREEATETEVQKLMKEVRVWRVANSAQWVAWGIVQAKVPEIDEASTARPSISGAIVDKIKQHLHARSDPLQPEVAALQSDGKADRPEGREQEEAPEEGGDEEDEGHEEFDYLAYAQERALFFWGDCLQLGLVKEEELPVSLCRRAKLVKY